MLRKKYRKYRNIKTIIDDIQFDSKREGKRYQELKLLQRTGLVKELELQPTFKISAGGCVDPNSGRMMPPRKYTADFRYFDVALGLIVVEDVKSPATAREAAYRLRRQLFIEQYGKEYLFKEI